MAVKNAGEYIAKHQKWDEELRELREMLLATEMEESIKWGSPVYTINNKNVVGLSAFKNHCGLWFFNGALLKENTALLQNAQEGKTKAMRQIRFEKGDRIDFGQLRKYVQEAIQNQKEGKEIKAETNKEVIIPPELEQAFLQDYHLQEKFKDLTPGRQREYCEYILEAKRDSTKQKRMEKIVPMILEGKGLNDKYKNC